MKIFFFMINKNILIYMTLTSLWTSEQSSIWSTVDFMIFLRDSHEIWSLLKSMICLGWKHRVLTWMLEVSNGASVCHERGAIERTFILQVKAGTKKWLTPRKYLNDIGYGRWWRNFHVTICNADDTLIFTPAVGQFILNIKSLLRCFHLVSGLRVNFYKSLLLDIKIDISLVE